MELRVHDLVRLAAGALPATSDAPLWVEPAFARAPWAVVRRAPPLGDLVPIGLRGDSRADRFAAAVSRGAIMDRLSPEQLARMEPPRRHAVFDALAGLAPMFDAAGLSWGPVGAAGYEIATGRATLTEESDLDLIVRAQDFREIERLRPVAAAARASATRIDILVETPHCGAALAELLGDGAEVLLRLASGPRLARRDALTAQTAC